MTYMDFPPVLPPTTPKPRSAAKIVLFTLLATLLVCAGVGAGAYFFLLHKTPTAHPHTTAKVVSHKPKTHPLVGLELTSNLQASMKHAVQQNMNGTGQHVRNVICNPDGKIVYGKTDLFDCIIVLDDGSDIASRANVSPDGMQFVSHGI